MMPHLDILDTILLAAFPVAMVAAGVSDLMTMRISNRISVGLIVVFAAFAAWIGLDWSTVGMHVLTALAVLALGFAAFSFGWMGGGDAKMATAIALWFGPFHTAQFLLVSSVFGGVLTLLLLGARNMPLPQQTASSFPWIARLHDAKAGIPYGIALAAGALIIYPDTLWLAAAMR